MLTLLRVTFISEIFCPRDKTECPEKDFCSGNLLSVNKINACFVELLNITVLQDLFILVTLSFCAFLMETICCTTLQIILITLIDPCNYSQSFQSV